MSMNWRGRIVRIGVVCGLVLCGAAHAEVVLAPLFQDHAVLQRDRPIPVWGTAAPGETVEIVLGNQRLAATADSHGYWIVRFDALPAQAEPLEFVAKGSNEVRLRDIVIGDVWLLSGQSNMEWPVRSSDNAEAEIAAANDSLLRHFRTERRIAHEPVRDAVGNWQLTTPQTAGHFSAVGYFFAREIRREVGVPIGLINASWGGTPVESWLPAAPLAIYPVRRMAMQHLAAAATSFAGNLAAHEKAMEAWTTAGAVPPPPPAPWVPGPEIAPGVLYNGMIAPHVPASLSGVLWYQGEANADQPGTYEVMFRALIESWRGRFQQPNLPFYWVQLANWAGGNAQGTNWAELRDAQTETLELPHTGQAVTIDIGDADDIHPRNKQDVGRRLARIALANVYGRAVVFEGPTFAGVERRGDELVVHFEHATGLHAREGSPKGFEIAGDDRIFHPATARVSGDTVILTAPAVTTPIAVRYAWRNAPVATLYNKAALPAVPFRSDDWDLE